MATIEVTVPDIGDFSDVEIIEVLVGAGDSVSAEDPLITLETDKASMDVPAPQGGTVKELKVAVGDRVSEGSPILMLDAAGDGDGGDGSDGGDGDGSDGSDGGDGGDADGGDRSEPQPAASAAPQRPASAESGSATPEPRPPPPSPQKVDEVAFAKVHASPSVRRFARELGVDLGQVEGSGRKGRITQQDVQQFVKRALSGGAPGAAAAGGAGIPPIPSVDFAKFGEIEEQPLTRIQRLSGPHLHRSWLNLPMVTQFDEADITELEAFRQALKPDAEKRGVRVTALVFIMKAAAAALQEFPKFNSSLSPDGKNLIFKKYCHIGIAVDTPDGLVVPVFRDVDKKSIFELSEELAATSAKARDGKLSPNDMQGGCFSISSLGGIGGTAFTPIVNAPEVAILGVSRGRMTPLWQNDSFVPRLMLPLSLTYDHRVIDGALGARFIVYLSQRLTDIRRLLL